MTAPDVSVIIPTRNRPEFLSQALSSALSQSGISLEVLVVNDGDGDLKASADPRVVIISNHGRGPVPARNLGVDRARGSVIAFLDDDDWWADALHLRRALDRLRDGADFIFADGILRYADGSPDLPFAFDADSATLERDNTILISTVCYRKGLHRSLGRFDESLPYYWDWDWHLRVARSGAAVERLPFAAAMIRVHGANMSSNRSASLRQHDLEALAHKHKLAPLVLKNHESIARAVHKYMIK